MVMILGEVALVHRKLQFLFHNNCQRAFNHFPNLCSDQV